MMMTMMIMMMIIYRPCRKRYRRCILPYMSTMRATITLWRYWAWKSIWNTCLNSLYFWMNMRTRLHNCSSNNNSNNKHRRRRRLHRHHPHLHHWYNRHSDTKEVLQKTNNEHCQATMNHVTNCHLLYQKGQLASSTVVIIIHTCACVHDDETSDVCASEKVGTELYKSNIWSPQCPCHTFLSSECVVSNVIDDMNFLSLSLNIPIPQLPSPPLHNLY